MVKVWCKFDKNWIISTIVHKLFNKIFKMVHLRTERWREGQ